MPNKFSLSSYLVLLPCHKLINGNNATFGLLPKPTESGVRSSNACMLHTKAQNNW